MAAIAESKASFSVPSILALIAALASFATGAILGLILALIAIVLGIIGITLSLSPRVRGGMVSGLSLVAGLIGVIAAVFKAIGWFF